MIRGGGKNLRKKSLLILFTVVALSAIMLISAATIYTTLTLNMTAHVAEAGTVTITINNVNYTNAQTLSLPWNTVNVGDNTVAVKIYNNVNTAVTPTITPTGLPTGWTLTLSDTGSIPARGVVTRNLVLTVPADSNAGDYSWSAVLNVSS
jgi:hypothetical protein